MINQNFLPITKYDSLFDAKQLLFYLQESRIEGMDGCWPSWFEGEKFHLVEMYRMMHCSFGHFRG